jgi:hypothetical protein
MHLFSPDTLTDKWIRIEATKEERMRKAADPDKIHVECGRSGTSIGYGECGRLAGG